MAGKIKVTLRRSRSRADKFQVKSLDGLGLKKREQAKVLDDTAAVRGMVNKVQHLVTVEPA